MKATKSKFSHTAIYIEIWNKPFVIDAQKDGVNVRPYAEWEKEYNYKIEVRRAPFAIDEKNFSLKATTKVGNTAYDFVGLLVKQPFELITGKWRVKKDENDKMYCSEYVAWCYGIKESYRMSPQDLYEWQLKNHFYEI